MVGIDSGVRRPAPAQRARRRDHCRRHRRTGGDAGVRRDRASSSTRPRRGAHARATQRCCARTARRLIDLTPAAIGPYRRPRRQSAMQHLGAPQRQHGDLRRPGDDSDRRGSRRVATVHYAEIVASIASQSAGPGTRANIDEFTETTARAIEQVGGARRGKAIIVLNPAEPPLIMRDTVFCLVAPTRRRKPRSSASIERWSPKCRRTCPAIG